MEFDNDRPVKHAYRIEILYWILLALINPLVNSLTIFFHNIHIWWILLLINLFILPAYLFYSGFIVSKFFFEKKYTQFFVLSISFVAAIQVLLFAIYSLILNFDLLPGERYYFSHSDSTIIRESLWCIINMSIATGIYFIKTALDEREALIALEKDNSSFRLKYLRSQLNPHFLFNTLNNMYYEAYLDSPRTALLIERLSEIMRYFVDQSNQETVPLATEVQFLDNYIALEKIRIRPEPEIGFEKHFDAGTPIPPMLLMTFVENIFKHGVDKISGCNKIAISLIQQKGYLYFSTKNAINRHAGQKMPGSLGLANLRKRLSILYDGNFELETVNDGQYFTATLKVPLHESTVHDSR